MKKLWCTFLTFIMLAALMPPAYVNAAQGIEITEVMYVDADGATHSDLYSFGDKITYKIKYNSSEASSVYVLMAYYNDKKMLSVVDNTEAVNAGEGIITGTEYLSINNKFEGIYSVKLFVFDSIENMQLVNNGIHTLNTENLYSKDLWYVNRDWNNASHSNDVISSEWDGDESNKQFGWANSKIYDYLYSNYRGGACPPVTKTVEEKKFGTAALKIAGAGAEDGIICGYPAGEHIVEHIIENGAGTYKFVLFAKMAESQTNVEMGARISVAGQNIYDYGLVTATTDWKKIEYDIDITQETFNTIINDSGTPSIALFFKLASGAEIQDIYFDKISFHKTGLARESFKTPANVVIRSKAAAGTDVTVVGTENGNIKFVSMAKASADGICENALAYDGNTDNITVRVISQNGAVEKSLSSAILDNGMKYLDLTYFMGSVFKLITQNSAEKPYHTMTLANGAVSFDVEFNEDASGVLVGVSYQDGVMTDYDTADISNGSAAVSLDGGNSVTLFGVNSLSEMKLISDIYTLDTEKLSESKVDLANSSIGSTTQDFNPVDGTIDVGSNGSGVQIVVLKPAGINEIAYIGVGELKNTLKCKINEDTYPTDSDYEVYISDSNSALAKTEGNVTYVTSTTLSNAYAVLSSQNVTEADVNSVITSSVLQIDLTDYNKISDDTAKRRARELFVEYKPATVNSVSTIQEILDKATGIVLLAQDAQMGYAEKYGVSSALDSVILGQILAPENSVLAAEVLRLMKENKLTASTITADNLNKIFKDAYFTAHFNVVAQKYGDIIQYMTDTFKSEIGADLTRLSNVNEPADVYKTMLAKKDYKNIQDINAKFIELTPVPTPPQDDGEAGSGSGSGSGFGGGMSIVIPGTVGTQEPTESVFEDVALTHWAYESIAKLVSKEIISKADNFRPSDNITREEFVKMIVCAFANESDAQQTSFADVDSSAWYANYIQTALDKEWINGMSENQFGIGRNITREDAVVIIFRVLQTQKENVSELSFSDHAQIADYAKDAVASAVDLEIISGYEDNSFRPKDSITRAECAKIIDRVMKVKGM